MMLFHIVVMVQRHVFQEIWRTEYVSEMGHFCELESRSQYGKENISCCLGICYPRHMLSINVA